MKPFLCSLDCLAHFLSCSCIFYNSDIPAGNVSIHLMKHTLLEVLQSPQWKTYGQIHKNENHHHQQIPTSAATKQECHRANKRPVAL